MVLTLFLLLTGIDGPGDYALIGGLLIGAGVALNRQKREAYNEFMVQLTLVLICAGNALLLLAISSHFVDTVLFVAGGAIVLGVLLLALCDHVQLCTAAFLEVCAGGALLVFDANVPFLADALQTLLAVAMTLTWLHARRWHAGPWSRLYEPVSRGLVTAFCLGLMTSLLDDMSEPKVGSVTTVTTTLLLLWVAYDAMRAAKLQLTGRVGGLIVLGVCGTAALTFLAPGVMGTALCLGLGLRRRSRWLVGVATVFFCVFMSRFYYQLSVDLLTKSGMLVTSGVLLFAMSRAALPRDGQGEASV